jgi:beta-phosphoglucomutase-like phosphatase (HAD superfamily)
MTTPPCAWNLMIPFRVSRQVAVHVAACVAVSVAMAGSEALEAAYATLFVGPNYYGLQALLTR